MDRLNIRAVIFDLGSTLIDYPSTDWDELSLRCLEKGRVVLAEQGLAVPDQETFAEAYVSVRAQYRKHAAETLTEWTIPHAVQRIFERLETELPEELLDKFFHAYYEPVSDVVYAYDDTAPTLRRIKERYGMIGLISNTVFPEQAHLDELDRFGLRDYFDFTIFSSTFGLRKPHEDIFLEAASRAGFAPAECVYIGDRYLEDVEGPTSVGMHSVLKFHPDRDYPEDKLPSLRVINKLCDLENHLDI